jgi:hypothetical protein
MRGLLLGSVAMQLLHLADVPITLVNSPARVARNDKMDQRQGGGRPAPLPRVGE